MKKKEAKAAAQQMQQIAETLANNLILSERANKALEREVYRLRSTLQTAQGTVQELAAENKLLQEAIITKQKYIDCLERGEQNPTILRQ